MAENVKKFFLEVFLGLSFKLPRWTLEFSIKSTFLKTADFCYKPSVFQPSKMFGFDFETCLTDMTVNGNLQLACLA